jgi:glycyl-tRNA synthetase
MEYSGKDLSYLDEVTHERYIPYIIETSAGLTRTVLVVLADAYDEEVVEGERRVVLHLHPRIAPTTLGVFPLVKKDGLAQIAHALSDELCEEFRTFYDESGAIGRRYRRQDEVGTPFCVTVDYQTKEDQTVTIRFRDSMEQVRVKMTDIAPTIRKGIKEYKRVTGGGSQGVSV